MEHLSNRQLFALAVGIWGTTWYAIVHQLAAAPPVFGVALRFALAGALLLAWTAGRRQPWRVPAGAHGLLALQGVFMYSLAYIGVYQAERHVPSGLVAVGYSASPLLAGVAARLLWGLPLRPRFVAGGLLGLLGVALIFGPEIAAGAQRPQAALGLAWTVAAVALSAVGALAASRNGGRGLAVFPAMGWAMLYSAACSLLLMPLDAPALPAAMPGPAWWISLGYLVVFGTVLAFGAFLTLQQRVGPGKAAVVGVATPLVALAVSALLEGYRPDAVALAGMVLAVAGNWMMLRSRA